MAGMGDFQVAACFANATPSEECWTSSARMHDDGTACRLCSCPVPHPSVAVVLKWYTLPVASFAVQLQSKLSSDASSILPLRAASADFRPRLLSVLWHLNVICVRLRRIAAPNPAPEEQYGGQSGDFKGLIGGFPVLRAVAARFSSRGRN